jgi:hypothetical protein
MLDYLDMFRDGFPDDYFDDEIKEMVKGDKTVVSIPGTVMSNSMTTVKLSGAFAVDPETDELTVGRLDYVKPNYDVKVDTQPSDVVLEWVEGYYEGGGAKFPHVPVARPSIPPSRYEKSNEFYVVYDFFIARGYRIFNPTVGQESSYPDHVDYVEDPDKFYITNKRKDFLEVKHALMLDFNPYVPRSAKSIKKIVMHSDGVEYTREWKEDEREGYFCFSDKRYHYDVWAQVVLSSLRYEDSSVMSSFDLIVKHYDMLEGLLDFSLVKLRPMLSDPVMVDPYDVYDEEFLSGNGLRSGLPYAVWPGRTFVPWSTPSYEFPKGDEVFSEVNEDRFVYKGYDYQLSTLHFGVRNRARIHEKLNEREEYARELASITYVLRAWTSSYDGTIVRRDDMALRRYIRGYVRGKWEGYSVKRFSVVPYMIARYPFNFNSTLIVDISMFTLEEFLKKWQSIYKHSVVPGWIREPREVLLEGGFTVI